MYNAQAIKKDFSNAATRYKAAATLQVGIGGKLIALAAPHLAANALLVDVGAGTGDVKWPVKTFALDAAWGMCREAAKKMPAAQARAEQLPLKDASVDAVASNVMLQWLARPELFFHESARVLKTGGWLAVSTFTQGTLCELAKAFALAGEQNRLSDFADPRTLARKIQAAGFTMVAEERGTIRARYDDVLDLCLHLRDIGATNKRENRPRGLLTLNKLREVAAYYPKTPDGITASWATYKVIARKR